MDVLILAVNNINEEDLNLVWAYNDSYII